jgi:molecular chaperone GrpE
MEKTVSENEPTANDDKVSGTNAGVADNVPEASEAAEATETNPESELDKLRKELTEQKDKYLRLYSEFENFRRRTSKERLELTQSANEGLLKVLLPVVDDFERAEKSFKDKNDKDLEGFFLIHNKFKKLLEQFSVKVMDIKKGTDFNADLHEAITQIPVTDEKLSGKVVDVVEKGYLLNDKVIRFAKVVVGA